MKNYFIFAIILMMCLCGVIFYTFTKNNALSEPKKYNYKIIYYDGQIPGNGYSIFVHEDISITVIKQQFCSTIECISDDVELEKTKFKVNFNDESKKIINKYIQKMFKDLSSNEIQLDRYGTSPNNVLLIESIIYEKEEKLKDLTDKNLIFEIYSNAHALPVQLKVYDDNTYEYIYSCIEKGKIGDYTYDVNKILNNIGKYTDDGMGSFTIKDNENNIYQTYNTNIELHNFLKSININLNESLLYCEIS